jgi:hypothetical protein
VTQTKEPNKGESNAWSSSVSWQRNPCAAYNFQFHKRLGPSNERQELPHGTAMPLGELQENMRVGEGLPLVWASARHIFKKVMAHAHHFR